MSNGTASTLILNPTGKTAITFNLTGATQGVATYTYIVDLGRLDLGEEDRWQWAYEQNRTGGRVVGSDLKMVPVRIAVIIKAATADYRKEAYRVLQEAVMNKRGGTLQYNPEGAGAGVLDTFYHYVASGPPRLVDAPSNRWDADSVDGLYTLQVDVELQTQPLATSDPASPVEVIASQVIDNWKDLAYDNRVSVSKTSLQGSFPALVRLIMEPWSGQSLGKVTVFRRGSDDGTLTNLVTLYEALYSTEIYPSTAWDQSATSIFPRQGRVCVPSSDGNDVAYGLRFTITSPVDHEGRFAVFGLGYDGAAAKEDWTHQVKLVSGNVSQIGADSYFSELLNTWNLIYAGEFELPITDLSDVTTGYEAGPYLEWYSTRHSGDSEFTLQAIVLVWVSDALGADGEGTALDVVCNDEAGVVSPERVLIENLLRYGRILERGYVMVQDNDIQRVLKTAPRGDFVELDPAQDHVLVFIHQRASGHTIIEDTFESYEAVRYLPILKMESGEGWTLSNAAHNTTEITEGSASVMLDTTGTATAQSAPLTQNLYGDERFNDPDYIVFSIYVENESSFTAVQIRFCTDVSNYFYHTILQAAINTGWTAIAVKKSSFDVQGSPTWATIDYVYFTNGAVSPQGDVGFDYLRAEKADPDISTAPNCTGTTWNFNSAKNWSVTDDVEGTDEATKTLATLNKDSALLLALADEAVTQDIRLTARVMTKKYPGQAGVAFRMTPESISGSTEGFLACIHTSAAEVSVYHYTSGAISATYSSAFECVPDRMYTMGVLLKQKSFAGLADRYDVYVALSSAIGYDDERVFDSEHHAVYGIDTLGNNGSVGLCSINALGRFDTFQVESITDAIYYEDQLRVEGSAIFRTISPFD